MSVTTTSRRAGRPSAHVLSRELIIEAALRLLDDHGPEGFGMRDVAAQLGVRVSSLYNHVGGKEDIVVGIREYMVREIGSGAFGTVPWDEALSDWARSYRRAFAAHPPTIALLAVLPITPDSTLPAQYERFIAALEAEGWEGTRALSILVTMESFVLGSALDAAAAPDMLDPGEREDAPRFTAAYRARGALAAASGSSPADLAFETGLGLLLDGLRSEHARL